MERRPTTGRYGLGQTEVKASELGKAYRVQRKNQGPGAGFTLVEIMIVVAILGLLASVAIPNFLRARENAQYNSIGNNLRILETCKEQWALENKKAATDLVISADLTQYLKNNTFPVAVAGETYTFATVGDLAEANFSGTLATHAGPFTITSF